MDSFTLEKVEFDKVRRILAGFCSCSLGRDLAERIGPSRRPETVAHWLAQTSEMVAAIRDVALPPFGGITDIRAPVTRACRGGAGAPPAIIPQWAWLSSIVIYSLYSLLSILLTISIYHA